MDQPEFKQKYSELRAKFGENYFGKNKGEQLFQLFKPVSNSEGQTIIDEILGSMLFTIDEPPGYSAFENLIKKVQTEKNRAQFRQQRAIDGMPPSWAELQASGQGDGLTKVLNEFGVGSVQELIQNKFKPRKA